MRVIGLCKTFSGSEFVKAAIKSVYPFLDKIVFINSDVSWTGEYGNTVKPVIEEWAKNNDTERKIVHFQCNVMSQDEQYQAGYAWAKSAFNPDWIMIFDTDEVWDETGLNVAKRCLAECTEYNAIAANMHTYIKSPFYKVTPPEWCKPTVFIRPVHHSFLGIRGNEVTPRIIPDDLYFHHFTYVRKTEKDVLKKIATTLVGDREGTPSNLVDMEKWIANKWNKLPKAKNFHTTKAYEKSWHKIEIIRECELPITVQGTPIIEQWRTK